MAATPETGYLILADLTGYTAYLAGSELEHAPIIAGDLLEATEGYLCFLATLKWLAVAMTAEGSVVMQIA